MTTKLILRGAMTPREAYQFETETGISVSAIEGIMKDPERPKMKLTTGLLLVALRRVNPKATLDDVLDGDYEIEMVPEHDAPLPPPSPLDA